MDKPEHLITLQQLAPLIGLSYQTALKRHNAGVLPHDFESLSSFLFKSSRVDELKAAMKEFGLNRAIKANIARSKGK